MAKVTDQNIPTELKALYDALASSNVAGTSAAAAIKQKKGSKKPRKKKRSNLDLVAFRDCAEEIANRLGMHPATIAFRDFVNAQIRELILGIYNAQYWEKLTPDSALTYESNPISVVDTSPPPYAYRDPLNQPTLPSYAVGTLTGAAPGYAGHTSASIYSDDYLRWRRMVFTLENIKDPKPARWLLMRWDVRIDVNTNTRGSRPMFALNILSQICNLTASACDSPMPPLLKKTSLYWRFKIPPSSAPFYNTYQVRKISKPLTRITKNSGIGEPQKLLIDASNRPMSGRGYNNNTQVTTTMNSDPEIFQISPCLGQELEVIYNATSPALTGGRAIAWGKSPGRFVTVNDDGGYPSILFSDDGKVWQAAATYSHQTFKGVAWSQYHERFIAVAQDGGSGRIQTSADGNVWESSTNTTLADWQCVGADDLTGRVVVAGRDIGNGYLMYSDDLIEWTTAAPAIASQINCIVHSKELGLWVASGSSIYSPGVTVMVSADGELWSSAEAIPDRFNSVAWSPDLALFCGVTLATKIGNIYTSPDGAHWTVRNSPSPKQLTGICWSQTYGLFVAVRQIDDGSATSSQVIFSEDGINWTAMLSGPSKTYRGIAASPQKCRIAACGQGGTGSPFLYSDKI